MSQINGSTQLNLCATTTMGLESVVARELKQLGFTPRSSADETGRVAFSGTPADAIRANLWLRSAGKVLVELARFDVSSDFDTIFDAVGAIRWEDWMPSNAAIVAEARSVKSTITSLPAIQRTVKKGIVNRLMKVYRLERLPEDGAAYTVELAIHRDRAVLTLDTTGRGLHRRGYRRMNVAVPLRETFAAALVQLSVWNRDRPLIDPFCASGTIPIEAALLGRNIAPGLNRSFAAEGWPLFPAALWRQERQRAQSAILPPLPVKIIGSDIDAESLRMAEYHAKLAGVTDDIIFRQADFSDLADERLYGCVIGNPPYGDRVGEREEFRALYESIPGVLAKLPTWSHYIITSWNDFESLIGRKADRRRKLYNSRIECTYFQFLGPRPPKNFSAQKTDDTGDFRSEHDLPPTDAQMTPQNVPTPSQNAESNSALPTETAFRPAFEGLDAMDRRQIDEFGRCLANRAKHLARYPKRGITSYRLYDRDFPEAPLAVDLFEGQWLHLAEYERPDERSAARHRLWLDALVERAGEILSIAPENRFLKRRRRQRGESQYEKLAESGRFIEACEGDLRYRCNMTDYLDVGLFLDHRITRQMVRKQAAGKRFLNLFCYTGSFTVAAAAGNAQETVSVDLSPTYLDWAEENMALNRFLPPTHSFFQSIPRLPSENGDRVGRTTEELKWDRFNDTTRHRFVKADVMTFLERIPAAERLGELSAGAASGAERLARKISEKNFGVARSDFDLCVCDPPTFSNSKSLGADWDVQRRHVELLRLLATRMKPQGVVYFSNNFRRFKFDEESLTDLYTIRDISRQTVPEEYRDRKIHRCWRLIRREE